MSPGERRRLPRGFGRVRDRVREAASESPTRQDLARRLGVATLTIQRILAGDVPDFRRGATKREAHAWARTLTRLALRFHERPADWVRGVGIPWSDEVRSIVDRPEAPPPRAPAASAVPARVVDVGIGDLRPFVDPLPGTRASFLEVLARRAIRAVSPRSTVRCRLGSAAGWTEELVRKRPGFRLAAGVFDTPFARSRGVTVLPLPGWEIELAGLCVRARPADDPAPDWREIVAGGSGAKVRLVVGEGDPAWSYLLGQCDRREEDLIVLRATGPEALGDALAEAVRAEPHRPAVLVSDEETCRRVEVHLRRRPPSPPGIDLTPIAAAVDERARYRLGVAVASDAGRWRELLEVAWHDELWGASKTQTARLYAEALATGAFSFPERVSAPRVPTNLRLQSFPSRDPAFEGPLCRHLLEILAGDRRLGALVPPERRPELFEEAGIRAVVLRTAAALLPAAWRDSLEEASRRVDWRRSAATPPSEKGPDRVLHWYCDSCSASLLESPGAAEQYCRYCSDENGNLRPREEVESILAQWMQGWQAGLSIEDARARAAHYMRGLPAWSDAPRQR